MAPVFKIKKIMLLFVIFIRDEYKRDKQLSLYTGYLIKISRGETKSSKILHFEANKTEVICDTCTKHTFSESLNFQQNQQINAET